MFFHQAGNDIMIVADSYMTIILPEDMIQRISQFIAGEINFPLVGKDELMCIMYIYGRHNGITGRRELEEASNLAQRTASQITQDIDIYRNSSAAKLDPEYIRSKYINRGIQLSVEKKISAKDRIASDPIVISDCFTQHIAYYEQAYFFELYGPLTDQEVTKDIRSELSGRMIMVCYNRNGAQDIGFTHPLIPVYIWFRDQAGAKP
jgi:hypothetical protein